MLLLIDNYDSFTWNLYQYFCELGAEVVVKRNDELTLSDISVLAPEKLVISPGPCTPSEAGFPLRRLLNLPGSYRFSVCALVTRRLHRRLVRPLCALKK